MKSTNISVSEGAQQEKCECSIGLIQLAVGRARAAKAGFVRIPRSFLTEVMPYLGGAELKCALVGYLDSVGRDLDQTGDGSVTIPWRRFCRLSGLARSTIAHALRRLHDCEVMTRTRQHDDDRALAPSRYRLSIQPIYERGSGSQVNGKEPPNANRRAVPPAVAHNLDADIPGAGTDTTASAAIRTGVVPTATLTSDSKQRISPEAFSTPQQPLPDKPGGAAAELAIPLSDDEFAAFAMHAMELGLPAPCRSLAQQIRNKFPELPIAEVTQRLPRFPGQRSTGLWLAKTPEELQLEAARQAMTRPKPGLTDHQQQMLEWARERDRKAAAP